MRNVFALSGAVFLLLGVSGGGVFAPCNGCYFWWGGDPLPGNWRTEPAFNSTCYRQLSETTPFGNKAVRLHIGNVSCADTGWGEKSALNGYRWFQSSEPNSHAHQGADVWYRFGIRFPSTWVGCCEEGNLTAEWHSNSSNSNMPTGSWETFMGVLCDPSSTNACVNPRLALTERAGQMASSGSYRPAINRTDDVFPSNSLRRNHWYDVVFHFVWSGTSSGQVQWWVDGKLVYQNLATPTLLVAPDGYVDEPDLDITNYRNKLVSTPSDVEYALATDGPTAASIGFSP
jgi:hypothetical protein